MSRPARWECEGCHRLLGEVIDGKRLRLARSLDEVIVAGGKIAAICPSCDTPRVFDEEQPAPLALRVSRF